MARGKKRAKELTPEEKLTQALVPIEEQPYKIPENWCYVPQRIICKLSNGEKMEGKEYPYLEVKYLRGKKKADILTKGKYIKESTKVILVDGENSGEVFTVVEDGYMGSTFKALDISSVVNQDYLLYFIATKKELYRNNKKGSAIPHLNKELFFSMPFPLAPLAEQVRIVDRIESIFAKLDEAKEKAQEVVDGFEMRKSAILHKAFTGELTKKWREEHRVTLESWRNKKINQVTVPRTGYAFESKKFCDKGYQIIRMGNLYAGQLDLSRKPVFISEDDVDDSILKHALVQEGDILITLTGTKYKRDYGYAVCITEPEMLLLNQRILCLSTTKDVERNYILYYLKSKVFRDIFFSNETGGVNQGNVSSKFVENIEIKIPLREEQCEIVQVLERMMEMEQQAKEIAEAVIEQIDVMKKAVLARAFRGELGTNDPKEESAVELLKVIL